MWGSLTNFFRSVSFPFFHHYQNTGYYWIYYVPICISPINSYLMEYKLQIPIVCKYITRTSPLHTTHWDLRVVTLSGCKIEPINSITFVKLIGSRVITFLWTITACHLFYAGAWSSVYTNLVVKVSHKFARLSPQTNSSIYVLNVLLFNVLISIIAPYLSYYFI